MIEDVILHTHEIAHHECICAERGLGGYPFLKLFGAYRDDLGIKEGYRRTELYVQSHGACRHLLILGIGIIRLLVKRGICIDPLKLLLYGIYSVESLEKGLRAVPEVTAKLTERRYAVITFGKRRLKRFARRENVCEIPHEFGTHFFSAFHFLFLSGVQNRTCNVHAIPQTAGNYFTSA